MYFSNNMRDLAIDVFHVLLSLLHSSNVVLSCDVCNTLSCYLPLFPLVGSFLVHWKKNGWVRNEYYPSFCKENLISMPVLYISTHEIFLLVFGWIYKLSVFYYYKFHSSLFWFFLYNVHVHAPTVVFWDQEF